MSELSSSLFTHFDHLAPPLGADGTPNDFYMALRDEMIRDSKPVAWSEAHGGFWVVTGYAEATQIWLDTATFSNRGVTFPRYATTETLMLAGQDPPDHQRARSIVAAPFSPLRVAEFEGVLRTSMQELIDGFIERGHADVAKLIGEPIPGIFTAVMLGLPTEDGPRLYDWTHAMTHEFVTSPDTAAIKIREFYSYFAKVIEERRVNPGTDVLSRIVHSEVNGERLNDEELRGFCASLMIGGIDNTTMLIGTMLWRLGWDRDLRYQLRNNPALIPSAIDEFLRFYSPASDGRIVMQAVTIGGCQMRTNDQVMLIAPVANRDPRVFPDPDTFLAQRSPNKHVALAVGIHRCLGAFVLKVEAKAVLEEFLRRIPDYEVDPKHPAMWNTGQVAGMVSVPIVFPPGTRESTMAPAGGTKAWLDHQRKA